MAHNPWKEIGETPGKKVAWNCVDKCQDVTCNRKCEEVYPNRGEELHVAKCRAERCKVEKTDAAGGSDYNASGVGVWLDYGAGGAVGGSGYGVAVGSGTGTRNSPDPAGTGTMNLMPTSGEACLSACNMAHNPWKEIGETLGKKVAWNCVDKCQDVTCNRKCQIVYPNRGEELTVATCRAERCKVEKTTDRPTNKNYGVKGGLRTYVTRKPSANYGIKS